MALIDFFNDIDGKREVSHGSDGRLNVSSRSDDRIYYISRDKSESYTAVFDDANASAGDYVFYIKNTNTNGKHLIISKAVIGCEGTYGVFKLATTAVAQSGGTAIVPVCQNAAAPKSAAVLCFGPTDSSSTPMTITPGVVADIASVTSAYNSVRIIENDAIRLGQDQAVAIELDAASATDLRVFGSFTFFFE